MYDKLLLVQKEIGAIKKDSQNPHFKNKYFDINTLLAEVKPVLNKHGIILTQALSHGINCELMLNTVLWDGKDKLESLCPVPQGADAQKTGSAITYFRRYALQSLLALEAEDDDANTASNASKMPVAASKPVQTTKVSSAPKDDPLADIGF